MLQSISPITCKVFKKIFCNKVSPSQLSINIEQRTEVSHCPMQHVWATHIFINAIQSISFTYTANVVGKIVLIRPHKRPYLYMLLWGGSSLCLWTTQFALNVLFKTVLHKRLFKSLWKISRSRNYTLAKLDYNFKSLPYSHNKKSQMDVLTDTFFVQYIRNNGRIFYVIRYFPKYTKVM